MTTTTLDLSTLPLAPERHASGNIFPTQPWWEQEGHRCPAWCVGEHNLADLSWCEIDGQVLFSAEDATHRSVAFSVPLSLVPPADDLNPRPGEWGTLLEQGYDDDRPRVTQFGDWDNSLTRGEHTMTANEAFAVSQALGLAFQVATGGKTFDAAWETWERMLGLLEHAAS